MSTKEITIYDIAKALQIHPSTVSRGLNNHSSVGRNTKQRIAEVAQTMGYQRNPFASSLRGSKTNILGVIISRVNSYFMSSVVSGMEKVANDNGYMLIVCQSQESSKKEGVMLKTMFNNRVDGLLVSLASDTRNLDHFNRFFDKPIPVVFFDRVANHPKCSNVVIDNTKAGFDATMHLIDQGCNRIVILTGNLNREVYSDRMKGYRQALLESGLDHDASYTITSDLDQQAGVDAAIRILNMNPPPDGIFACNDTAAVSCLCELKKAGIQVPQQIAIVGFNNDPISRVVQPNLTTIEYRGYEMGEVAMGNLIDTIYKRSARNVKTIVLTHELIVRQSSSRLLTIN